MTQLSESLKPDSLVRQPRVTRWLNASAGAARQVASAATDSVV
jgi:hypothetical protein